MHHFLLLSVLAAIPACCDSSRVVARTDHEVPAEWTSKKILNRDFWPCFYASGQSARSKRPGSVEPDWDLSIFRECGVAYGSCSRKVQPIIPDKKNHENYAYRNTNRLVLAKYTLRDYFESYDWRFVEEWPKSDTPAFMSVSAERPAYFLPKTFPTDREWFRKWLEEHPNFIAFEALAEFDSDSAFYNSRVEKCPDKSIRDELLAQFPVATNDVMFIANMREAASRAREFYFGTDRIWSLYSSMYALAHMYGEVGMKGLTYEATGQEYARWQIAAAYLRGAARQFDIPYTWYLAHFLTQYDRKSQTCKLGHNYWTGDLTPSYKTHQCGPWFGLGHTMVTRGIAYSWLIGCSMLEFEDWIRLFRDRDPAPGGRYRPHRMAQEFDYFYGDTKVLDRGVHYTPCAILAPMLERHNAAGMKASQCRFSLNSFFLTLVPIGSDLMQRQIKKLGNQGCLFNTPYGEFCDVVVPDSSQSADRFAKALSSYKLAFLAGDDYMKETFNAEAIKKYVENGGTLVVSWDRIADGLVPAELAGIDFASDAAVTPAGTVVSFCNGSKRVLGDIGEGYAWAKPLPGARARQLLKDDKGNAAGWVNDYGKGRVVTIGAYRFLKDDVRTRGKIIGGAFVTQGFAGKRKFPLVAALLDFARSETMPVSVEGDCQWGVNRTKKGWTVWMFNNKGVEKYFGEPEIYNAFKTVKARIVFPGKKEYEVALTPGDWRMREFDFEGNLLGLSKADLTEKCDAFVAAARKAYRLPGYAAYTNSLVDSAEFSLGIAQRPRQPGAATVKWIEVDGSSNFRDIGGWTGLKPGLVYRGAEINCQTNPAAFAKGQLKSHDLFATEKGLETLSARLGIKTDLDLRAPHESPTPDATPIPGAKLVRLPISAYTNALRAVERKNLAAALRVFADEANYPVYFHCYGGADRTGTLAFLLEGLCGVDEADLAVDYELTTYGLGRRARYDKPYFYASLVKEIKKRPGATLKDKIESFVKNELGLTDAEVSSIRRILKGA